MFGRWASTVGAACSASIPAHCFLWREAAQIYLAKLIDVRAHAMRDDAFYGMLATHVGHVIFLVCKAAASHRACMPLIGGLLTKS